MNMIYGYIRVSTDTQTVENQRCEIERYIKEHNLKIDKYFEETISGTKEYNKRRLGKLLSSIKEGDTLIASELSRLGRSFYMIMEILNICLNKGVKVITIKDKFIVSVKVGEKGQIIVPKEAREMFNISSGDTLLFLGDKQKGLALVKADAIYDLVDDRK